VAAVLGLVLAALAACNPTPPPSTSRRGSEIYATMGCLVCHGANGAGSTTAPPLTDLAQHWDRAGLAAYLEDPRSYIEKDARLAALKQRFGTEMPALGLPEADRLALADYLLGLPAAPGP
jgi:mono/diheme cytochrome c family protein